MTNILSELNVQRMLALTKAALHGTTPDENLFVNAGETEWNEVFERLATQGVMALTLDEAMRLPKELQPPLSVRMRWIASVEAVEKRYRHQLKTAKKLSAYFRENNIRMLLFKGIALSRLYPVPVKREFGDIDIFLCGKPKEGDALLERIAKKEYQYLEIHGKEKHVIFTYRGILIENHHTFLNHYEGNKYKFHRNEALEKRLMMILTEAGIMEPINFAESNPANESLLFPPPNFDALFVTLHLLGHFFVKNVLRRLCDLTVLFTAYKGKIDFSMYRNALSEAGLIHLVDAFISLSVRYLGLNPEYAPPYDTDLALENKLWDNLWNPEIPPLPKEKRTLINIIIHKIKLLQSNRWKSELVFPGQYWKKILSSAFLHLRHPELIRKLNYDR